MVFADGEEDGGELGTLSPDNAKVSLSYISDNNKFKWNIITKLVKPSSSALDPIAQRGGDPLPAQTTSGRVTFDTYLSYDLTSKLNLRLGIRNLSDVKYWDFPTVSGQAEGTADEYLMPGRNTSFSIRSVSYTHLTLPTILLV